jgi:hypothetical protein
MFTPNITCNSIKDALVAIGPCNFALFFKLQKISNSVRLDISERQPMMTGSEYGYGVS